MASPSLNVALAALKKPISTPKTSPSPPGIGSPGSLKPFAENGEIYKNLPQRRKIPSLLTFLNNSAMIPSVDPPRVF
jgi:hypothetical protein